MRTFLLIVLALFIQNIYSQDTFSIVAVDTVTGEIGSAGASCIDASQIEGGALIISDVIPGRGAIHTQSYWNSTNQQNAHNRMVEGMSPEEIIQWLTTHDSQNNPAVRQYGIVDFDSVGHARSAGFTGVNCMDYKNHITGPNYAIQGNILLGQQILDSIESRFLNTEGSFSEKMMAALQGAKVVGADTRCTSNGTSSLSAFIRIARPGDTAGAFYCDLNVPEVPEGMEPIDSLQTLFDAWWETVVGTPEKDFSSKISIYPNPAKTMLYIDIPEEICKSNKELLIFDQIGRLNRKENIPAGMHQYGVDVSSFANGIYLIMISNYESNSLVRKFIINK